MTKASEGTVSWETPSLELSQALGVEPRAAISCLASDQSACLELHSLQDVAATRCRQRRKLVAFTQPFLSFLECSETFTFRSLVTLVPF